jgi:hypothetical protein
MSKHFVMAAVIFALPAALPVAIAVASCLY